MIHAQRYAIAIICAALICGTSVVRAAQEGENTSPVIGTLMTALAQQDYDAFVAQGTDAFKATLTRFVFNSVSSQLASRIHSGYELHFLGTLNQQGHIVYLWKVVFADAGDDALVKLVMEDELVAGFWVQ